MKYPNLELLEYKLRLALADNYPRLEFEAEMLLLEAGQTVRIKTDGIVFSLMN